MARRVRRNDGLRKLLIAERERGLKRWPVSTGDEYLDGLRSGGPVLVSSSQLMRALMHARLPYGTYCFGGADFGRLFVLGADGALDPV